MYRSCRASWIISRFFSHFCGYFLENRFYVEADKSKREFIQDKKIKDLPMGVFSKSWWLILILSDFEVKINASNKSLFELKVSFFSVSYNSFRQISVKRSMFAYIGWRVHNYFVHVVWTDVQVRTIMWRTFIVICMGYN